VVASFSTLESAEACRLARIAARVQEARERERAKTEEERVRRAGELEAANAECDLHIDEVALDPPPGSELEPQ